MKTFKLILKSLVSNNACIDGGRKRPWYIAAIMFFLAMIFAILPMFIQTLNTNGDDAFKTNTYGLDVATLRFNEELEKNHLKMYVKTSASGEKFISCEDDEGAPAKIDYNHKIPVQGSAEEQVDYIFHYRAEFNQDEYAEFIGDEKTSLVLIYQDRILIHVVNFETKTLIQNVVCTNAPKYLNEGRSINALLSSNTDLTAKLNETFGNWKLFIRDAYTFARLTATWNICAIMGGINVGVTLFLGLMIWILTRGKNNPYRLFNPWDCQKMAWWTTITPAILALAFGFLIPRFANILYPMILAVRVMWLSMRSLRPDGSGYAAD